MKFINFLVGLKNDTNKDLLESVRIGYSAIFENNDIDWWLGRLKEVFPMMKVGKNVLGYITLDFNNEYKRESFPGATIRRILKKAHDEYDQFIESVTLSRPINIMHTWEIKPVSNFAGKVEIGLRIHEEVDDTTKRAAFNQFYLLFYSVLKQIDDLL